MITRSCLDIRPLKNGTKRGDLMILTATNKTKEIIQL